MKTVHSLPPQVIARIAAGEVIERPSYAIKELIENALDAKANNIHLELENAGLDKILIVDDGVGMSKEDLLVSFLPHTTSKIDTEDDLFAVKTLGFRGEALSSIAAISSLTIQSRQPTTNAGHQVEVVHGKLKRHKLVGIAPGTRILIQDLFGSVPARKKFLKSIRTEFRHCLEIVLNHALANPSVGFTLTHNKKLIIKLPSKQTLSERLEIIQGSSVVSHLLPLYYDDSYISVTGFISRPQLSFTSPNKNLLFVNNRPVWDNLIISSIKLAYSNLLEKDRYPACILFVSVPHELIDVNVHPRKEQIRFVDSNIGNLITSAVSKTLSDNNLTFFNLSWKDDLTTSSIARELKTVVSQKQVAQITKIDSPDEILQIHDLYLVVSTNEGVMFIDQHAAHEAILYQEYKKEFLLTKSKKKISELTPPQVIELDLKELELFEEYADEFKKLGFQIEEFGSKHIKVTKVPKVFGNHLLEDFIKEILIDLENNLPIKDVDQRTQKMLAYLACRSAIKAGERLTLEQRKKLILSLNQSHFTYTCPHGRPVKLAFSLKELDRLFKRS